MGERQEMEAVEEPIWRSEWVLFMEGVQRKTQEEWLCFFKFLSDVSYIYTRLRESVCVFWKIMEEDQEREEEDVRAE